MSSFSDEENCLTPKELREEVSYAEFSFLPQKSRELYSGAYELFNNWRLSKSATTYSETVLLSYFIELSKTKQPSTLWSTYSMLTAVIKTRHNVHTFTMVIITGDTLGERQRNLNSKVAEVIAAKTDFSKIKTEEETTDVDKLYKIDIACHHRDIDYIIEVLKSGDSLYITRALRCLWLYHNDYKHIINSENLHCNIFPYMPIKMKHKMLSTISMYIKNDNRASDFFFYCNDNKMPRIAFKFLTITSEEFKLNVLKNEDTNKFSFYLDSRNKLINFIGDSFVLAITLIKSNNVLCGSIVDNLRFLYSLENDKYLDILEEYERIDINEIRSLKRLGIRISKDIMIKHKHRVLEKPLLYINKLHKSMLIKYSTSDDAKTYMAGLLPQTVKQFWNFKYFTRYDFILNLIPANEKFQFLKDLFSSKYPEESLEMNKSFYELNYFDFMTIEEKELWALRHLADQNEYLGEGEDYKLYQFVSFDKAFVELKKYIMKSTDKYLRSVIVNLLLRTARDQKDLAIVLNYYYDRHINEKEHLKESFVHNLLSYHNVFEFDNECWEALNKLFNSLRMYDGHKYYNRNFMAIAVTCHILHNKTLPQTLTDFIDQDINYTFFSDQFDKLGKDKSEIIFQYLLKVLVNKLEPFEQDPYNKKLRKTLKKYVSNIFTLLNCFKKGDDESPEIVKKFIEIDSPKREDCKYITDNDIYKFLKSDVNLAIDVLSQFEKNIDVWPTRLSNVLRKLKVYFSNDVAPKYLNFFDRWLHKSSSDEVHPIGPIFLAIFAIFQLADENFKVAFMEKYQPAESKIDFGDDSSPARKLRIIQEAICRLVGYSRPPVPLDNVLKYVKGDFVRFCLPMFNMYFVNIPMTRAIQFIEATINAPMSVQKHGIRLAFKCYTKENLKTLALNVWKSTENVSLRLILYKLVFNKVIARNFDENTNAEMYEILKLFTLDMHEDDDGIYDLIKSNKMPHTFMGDYLETAWNMVIKLPKKPSNLQRQIEIIHCINKNLRSVQRDFVRKCIVDEHVQETLGDVSFRPYDESEYNGLQDAKWELTANYIVHYTNNMELEDSLSLTTLIFTRCIDMWNVTHNGRFIFQMFYYNFLDMIKDQSFERCLQPWCNSKKYSKKFQIDFKDSGSDQGEKKERSMYSHMAHLFKHILIMLKEALPMKEICLPVWKLQLTIYARISVCRTDWETEISCGEENDTQFSSLEVKITMTKFAKHVGQFVQELLSKHHFYPILLPQMAKYLEIEVEEMYEFMELELKEELELLFCESLANIGMKETHLLTLMILPDHVPEEQKANRTRILKIIQEFDDEEVQAFMYFTCVSNDNENRF